MAKLFGMEMPDTSAAQATQRRLQARQTRQVQEEEIGEQKEIGARRRLLQARTSGGSSTLFGAPAGVAPSLGG